jgi:DNA sulfur modification protein DndC
MGSSGRASANPDDQQIIRPEVAEKLQGIIKTVARRYQAPDKRPWIVGFSGGKDSTLLLHLVFEAIRVTPPKRRGRPVYVLSSDTQVETPAIIEFLESQITAVNDGAKSLGLPITAHLVRPEIHETYWARLIGYGYPAPNKWFRWCTERLKIKPANAFILQQIDSHGEVIMLLGTRYDESSNRARSIRKHEGDDDLNPHSVLRSAYVWAPIKQVLNDEVWEYLAFTSPPWGGTHRRLQNLYKEANSGECPLVFDESTKPCGNSRFGCWTCTVVDRDRSMEGFIGSGREEYQGMADFRNWLIELRDHPAKYREPIRRNGEPGNGPLKMEVREEVLRRLLSLQDDLGQELISEAEVNLIRQIWVSDRLVPARMDLGVDGQLPVEEPDLLEDAMA